MNRPRLLLLVLVTSLARADVHVVDAAGAGDFVELQAAVDAAAPGDILLMREGAYGYATLHRGIDIAADEGAIVSILGGLTIASVPPGESVTLSKLRVAGEASATLQFDGVRVLDCDGAVRIQDCILLGGVHRQSSWVTPGGDGAYVKNSSDVAFIGCTLLGGIGEVTIGGNDSSRGGRGLFAEISVVVLQHCTAIGGDGNNGDLDLGDLAAWAGEGVLAESSELDLLGGLCRGGQGGGDMLLSCHAGGAGLRLEGSSISRRLGTTLEGGPGATAGVCNMPDGPPIEVAATATDTVLPGTVRQFDVDGVVRVGAPLDLDFSGEPGDAVYLLLAPVPGRTDLPALSAPLLVGPQLHGGRRYMGGLDAFGQKSLTVPGPALSSGMLGESLHMQGLFLDPSGGLWLHTARRLVILDPSL